MFIAVAAALGMALVVAAVDAHWLVLTVGAVVLLAFFLTAGTRVYRLSPRDHGRVQAHALMRASDVDLRGGFDVRQGRLGPQTLVLRAQGKTYRLAGGLGGSVLVEQWLHVVGRS